MFQTEGIDHIAIMVRDVKTSAAWYQGVLGLERRYEAVWGDHPAVVGAGTTSIALFPVAGDNPKPRPDRNTIAMRHLALRVSRSNFDAPFFTVAKSVLASAGIPYSVSGEESLHLLTILPSGGHSAPMVLNATIYVHPSDLDAAQQALGTQVPP